MSLPVLGELFVFSFRLRNMVVKCRTKRLKGSGGRVRVVDGGGLV
jgi:hypothetical protein